MLHSIQVVEIRCPVSPDSRRRWERGACDSGSPAFSLRHDMADRNNRLFRDPDRDTVNKWCEPSPKDGRDGFWTSI